MDDHQPQPLPPGDITWDGATLTIDGQTLPPGLYQLDGGGLLVVETAEPPTTPDA